MVTVSPAAATLGVAEIAPFAASSVVILCSFFARALTVRFSPRA